MIGGKKPATPTLQGGVYALKQLPEQPDAELIDAILDGDSPAFETLIGRYQERVFRLLSRFSRDRGEVEDLAQEVFLKVYRKLDTFQRGSGFYTWLYRIAVNSANDYLARMKRRRLYLVEDCGDLELGARRGGTNPSQPLLDEEVREVTREILQTLPEKYRTILVLREYEDMSYTTMAEVLQCSIGTVESRLFRARQRFKDALARTYPDLVPQLRGGAR